MKTKKQEELDYLKRRCLLIINFFQRRLGDDPFYGDEKRNIEIAHEEGMLGGLRQASRDLDAKARGFSKNILNELQQLLKQEFGDDGGGEKRTLQILNRVVKRGRITSDEEYRIVHDYISDVTEGAPLYNRLHELEATLNTFEPSKDA